MKPALDKAENKDLTTEVNSSPFGLARTHARTHAAELKGPLLLAKFPPRYLFQRRLFSAKLCNRELGSGVSRVTGRRQAGGGGGGARGRGVREGMR